MKFGEKLVALRIENRLSQEKLAQMVGVDWQTVALWEVNQALPENRQLIELSDIFQIPISRLLDTSQHLRTEEIQDRITFCTQCGQPNKDGGAFCVHCGLPLDEASLQQQKHDLQQLFALQCAHILHLKTASAAPTHRKISLKKVPLYTELPHEEPLYTNEMFFPEQTEVPSFPDSLPQEVPESAAMGEYIPEDAPVPLDKIPVPFPQVRSGFMVAGVLFGLPAAAICNPFTLIMLFSSVKSTYDLFIECIILCIYPLWAFTFVTLSFTPYNNKYLASYSSGITKTLFAIIGLFFPFFMAILDFFILE